MKKLFTIIISLLFLLMIPLSQNSIAEKPPYTFDQEIKINEDGDWTNKQGGPSIAIYENIVYITWWDQRNDAQGTYFAKSTDAGENFSSNKKIGDLTGSLRIVVGDTGNIYGVLFWSEGNVTFVKSTNGGDTFSEPIKVNDEASDGLCEFPRIAVDNDDNIYIVWEDHRNHLPMEKNSNPDIYIAKSTDSGESFGQNIRVNDDLSLSHQTYPDIAVSEDGEVHVVWADSRNDQPGGNVDWDIYFAKSSDGGESFDDNVMVSHDETHNPQGDPKIVTDNTGNIYVVWGDQRPGQGDESGNYKIYFSKSTNGGSSFGPDVFIKGGVGYAGIAADDKGVYIVYEFGIGYLIYSKNGETFSEPLYVTPEDNTPRIALDNQSNIYIVWTDDRSGYGDIYFKKGIRTEPSNENGENGQNNHRNQDFIDSWLWIIVAVILIACVAYIAKRKHSGKPR